MDGQFLCPKIGVVPIVFWLDDWRCSRCNHFDIFVGLHELECRDDLLNGDVESAQTLTQDATFHSFVHHGGTSDVLELRLTRFFGLVSAGIDGCHLHILTCVNVYLLSRLSFSKRLRIYMKQCRVGYKGVLINDVIFLGVGLSHKNDDEHYIK